MQWKRRKSGKRYLYRNRRHGRKVVSEYLGAGPVAELVMRFEALYRAEQEAAHQGLRTTLRQYAAADVAVRELFEAEAQLRRPTG